MTWRHLRIVVNERRQLIADLCDWYQTESLSFRCHTFDHVTHIFGLFLCLRFRYSTKPHDCLHFALWRDWNRSLLTSQNTSLTPPLEIFEHLRLNKMRYTGVCEQKKVILLNCVYNAREQRSPPGILLSLN